MMVYWVYLHKDGVPGVVRMSRKKFKLYERMCVKIYGW